MSLNLKKITQRLQKVPFFYLYLLGAVVAGGLALVASPPMEVSPPQSYQSLDTYIPEGFVLVPIEVKNYESLDLVIGKYGVVDLYQIPGSHLKRPKPVAKAIKMVRSPLNPSVFAVLVPDDEAHIIVKSPGPFQVVVKNPKEEGVKVMREEIKKNRKIIIGGER